MAALLQLPPFSSEHMDICTYYKLKICQYATKTKPCLPLLITLRHCVIPPILAFPFTILICTAHLIWSNKVTNVLKSAVTG